jgi:serine/threonine-protein kinase SRPK3
MTEPAQFLDDQTTDDITPLGLRPPEIILGAEWDHSVDIWTFGCLVSIDYHIQNVL